MFCWEKTNEPRRYKNTKFFKKWPWQNEPIAHAPLPAETERIATLVVDAAFAVHKTLGARLLESVYEPCFCYELQKRSLKFERQVLLPIIYDGIKLDDGLRLDVLVEGQKQWMSWF